MWSPADSNKPQAKITFLNSERVVVNVKQESNTLADMINGKTAVVLGSFVMYPKQVVVAIQFDEVVSPLLHDCNGLGQQNRCMFMPAGYLELVK